MTSTGQSALDSAPMVLVLWWADTVKRVRDVAPLLTQVHCSIHREALAAKRMPMHLKNVLDEAVRMVNYIKSRPLQARLFSLLCQEMGSEHRQLLLHTVTSLGQNMLT